MPYSKGFKARMIQRLTVPNPVSANALAGEVGVCQATLSRWLRDHTISGMSKDQPSSSRRWTASEKLRIVLESFRLDESELGKMLRREGVHDAQLKEWQDAVTAGAKAQLEPKKRKSGAKTQEQKKIESLEREVNRKDKALAELTALITLKKKSRRSGGTRTATRPRGARNDHLTC